jgi:uncharacterized protein involved in outer membrane biogenesis
VAEGLEIDGVVAHGGQDTGGRGARATGSRPAARLGILGIVIRRRLAWLALALLLGAALLTAATLLLLPRYARELVTWQLERLTARAVHIEALELSLAGGRFSVRGLRITDHDGGLLAELERLDGRFRPLALLRAHVWLETLALDAGRVRIVRTGPDRFNISDLLERRGPARQAVAVSVDRFTVTGGWVQLEDRTLSPTRTWRSEHIWLQAQDVTTRGPHGTAVGSTTVAGALVTLRVEDLQLAPVHLRAHVNVRDLDLTLAALYLPPDAAVRLARGTVHAGIDVALDARDGVRLDAEAVVEGLALRRPGLPDDALAAPELRLLVRELRQRGEGLALRYASAEGDVTVLDPTTTPPRRLTFADLTLTVSGIDELRHAQAQVALHATVPGGGEIDVGGTAGIAVRRADLRVRARRVELAALAPYLPLAGRLDGLATADVQVVAAHDRALQLRVTGQARVERVTLGDGVRTPLTAAALTATGLRYTWPAAVALDRLVVTQPVASVQRDAGGGIDVTPLFRRPPEQADAAAPGARAEPDLRVGELTLEDGRVLFTDAASGARLDVRRLALTARDVSWPGRGSSALTLSASVAGADVTGRGTVDAARRAADLALVARGADLAVVRPWLPIAGRVDGVVSRADLRLVAAHEHALALRVTGDITLETLALGDDARRPVSAARLTARGLDFTWPATVRITSLTLGAPDVSVERDASGALDLLALLRPASPATGSDAPAHTPVAADVAVGRLRIEDARVRVRDAATGGGAELSSLGLTARDVAWPARGASRVRLAATLAGGHLSARGTVDAVRRRADLALTLRGADLAVLQPWLPMVGRVRGAADADVSVSAGLQPPALAMQGSVGVTDLAFLEGTRPLLTVARVEAGGLDLQWPTRLAIERLRVDTPWAQIDRTPDGELSLRAIFRTAPGRAPVGSPAAAGGLPGGLQVSVRDALFENGGTSIVDDAVEPAARFEVRGSRLALGDLTWPSRGPATVQLSTMMPAGGTLRARGTFSIEPTRLTLEVDLDQVNLAPARPYLPLDVRLSGRLSGRATVAGAFDDTVALAVDGNATVDRLALGDSERRLATAQRAELTGFSYRYPASIRIAALTLRRPWALIERDAAGRLELASMLVRRRAPGATVAGGAAPAPGGDGIAAAAVQVGLQTVTLEDGFLRFVDRSTEPDYAEELSGITLQGEGIGTDPGRPGTVSLQGRLASGTPLAIRGQVGALTGPRFVDLTLEVRDLPVPRLNPYLAQLSAWIARQGRLTAALHYKIHGDDLEASNLLALDGLELDPARGGNEVQQRVGLPLDLLVSLLKDRQGNIRITLPVGGRLSAPDFDYGDAMWTALRNLSIRLVSLPFSWVGKMFYTADARIDALEVYPVTFQTASTAPTVPGYEQLDRLATFLRDSPAIRLRVRPVTTVADVTALRRAALEARLGGPGADPAARRRAALALYAELFPRRAPPASDAELLEALTRETRTPGRALRTLAQERVAAIREALARAGVPADRLQPADARAAVESEGEGRVEFEIVP